MSVTRADVRATLSHQPAAALRSVLEAAKVSYNDDLHDDAPGLAHKIADALWWAYCTPLGYTIDRASLDDIVAHVAKKAGLAEQARGGDAWAALGALTRAIVGQAEGGVALEDVDPSTRARLFPSVWPTLALGTSSGAAYGVGAVGRVVKSIGATPIGRVLPLLPTVGPWFGVVTRGAGVAAAVGTPAAAVLAVATVNQAMGTNYQRLVPLLLGVGALRAEPVVDAHEAPPEPADS
jgi:hypothetical protein